MGFMKMFLKKRWKRKYNYYKGKADFYYARYQEEEKKETTFSSTTYVINGKERTIIDYTEHVPFFLYANEKNLKSSYYNKYLSFSRKATKYQNFCC